MREKEETRDKKQVCINNCQLRLQAPPHVVHASQLDQNLN